jgi:HD-GYP domain-containing protein (c-di-GMP phosphodiesterase class II)
MKTKIEVQDLKLGMYIADLDTPWENTPFVFKGFVLESEHDLQLIQRGCQFVYVDWERSADSVAVSRILNSMPSKPTRPKSKRRFRDLFKKSRPIHSIINVPATPASTITFDEEIDTAKDLRQNARSHIYNMLEDVRVGKSIDSSGTIRLISKLVDSIIRNPDALTWMTQLKSRDEYTAMHSFNVCVLSLGFGRHLNISRNGLVELGCGALLHDIGKIRVPLEILNKPGKLTDEEFSEMRNHTTYGKDILTSSPNILRSAVEIAYTHHERMEGQGYPRGLRDKDLSLFSKMVAIVDTYDAITSDRVYRKGRSPVETLGSLYHSRGGSLDKRLVESFIQCLGIFPVGTLVELSNLEVGIVVSSIPESRLLPKVLVVMDKEKRFHRPHRVVDLASEAGMYIKTALEPGAYGIRSNELIADSA